MDNKPTDAGMSFYEQVLDAVMDDSALASEPMQHGIKLGIQDNLEEALQFFAEACRQTPGSLYAWLCRGYTELSLLLYHEAETSFLRAKELDSKNVLVRYWLAHTHFLNDLVEEAVGELKDLILDAPEFLDAYYDCGVALQIMGRYDDAMDVFLRRLEISPDFDTYIMAAMTYELQLDFENAAECYARALEIEPENIMVIEAHGATCLELGRLDEAMSDFQFALEIDPESPDALYGRGRTFFLMEKIEDARRDLQKVVELDPESALAWSMLGQLALYQEFFQPAIDFFNKAQEVDPDILIYGFRGQAKIGMDEYKSAADDLTLALDFEPKNPDYYQERGMCLFFLGRAEEALSDFQTAAELDISWDGYELRGLAHSELAHFEEAISDLGRAIEMTPDEIDLYLYRAEAYCALMRTVEAAEDIRTAQELAEEAGEDELVAQCTHFLKEISKAEME